MRKMQEAYLLISDLQKIQKHCVEALNSELWHDDQAQSPGEKGDPSKEHVPSLAEQKENELIQQKPGSLHCSFRAY